METDAIRVYYEYLEDMMMDEYVQQIIDEEESKLPQTKLPEKTFDFLTKALLKNG